MSLACRNKGAVEGHQQDTHIAETSSAMIDLYVGTYTRKEGHVNGKASGIHHLHFDPGTGELSEVSEATGIVNPSYLALRSNGRVLYAVSEMADSDETVGLVYSCIVEADGSVKPLKGFPTGGNAPCHVSLDHSGRYVFVANYLGGVVRMYRSTVTGNLTVVDEQRTFGSGPHPEQGGPHPHGVFVSPDDKFVFVPDKGTDGIWSFRIDRQMERMVPTTQIRAPVKQGSGPRHMTFHPRGSYVYVLNELDCSVSGFMIDSVSGMMSEFQNISTVRSKESKSWAAAIRIDRDGKFLYCSNRGENTIAAFSIDQTTGLLTLLDHVSTKGEVPRDFNIDPTGNYLLAANQNSDNISVFRVDRETGLLSDLNYAFDVETPVCIVFAE